MSRRSLRLVTTAHPPWDGQAMGAHSCTSSAGSLKDGVARTVKQRRSASKVAFNVNHVSRQVTSSGASQGGSKSLQGAVSLRPPVLDESLIREQTKVDHFWGLDDDGDLKGGNKAAIQGNGDLAAGAAGRNGYICSDCSMLSERRDALTAHSTAHGLTSRIYSRDRDQKRKAASGLFWWLGIGWYQFVTLISWLNVFLLTRCLRNFCKFLILFIPLLLLLAGLSSWGQGDFLSFLPILNWTNIQRTQSVDDPGNIFKPETSYLNQPPQGDDEAFRWRWTHDMEQQVASLSGQCHSHDVRLRELTALLEKLKAQVDQMDEGRAGLSALVRDTVGQHLRETDFMTFHQKHEVRISNLEGILGKLTEKSEAIQRELEETKLKTTSGADEQQLLSTIRRLELELGHLRSELSSWQHEKTSCEKVDVTREKVDAQVRETVKLILSEDQQDGSFEWLLQKFSSQFVSKDDLQILLRDLELQILTNITHHISVTKQMPTSETVVSAVNEAGVSGITEAQAHVIVNNALKLYSQDKTGMVDFALESGGGSILSTRCSETYETKTALISLFGIPLWYFSQSPRVVIQPDMYPGNCWAFKGSQGYLVVRLSMVIHPTAVTLEHIPKTLSPTGNITSAPKDFAVYGLENEYQEDGWLLGQFTYDHEGESLQTFHVLKRPDRAFQVVELRISSNWGHPEYTCLYRFRVHGEPVK
uniref:Sad1 and UNC84 domain containing 1 n=1 Tax=Prolemur simus TaxID=1328070 RepID=A0A8C9AAW2_PROSS